MEHSIYEFLKAVDENNRACEMAMRYAVMILNDLMGLSREGQKIMANKLTELISIKM